MLFRSGVADEKVIQDHLDSCPSCQQILDAKMTESESSHIKPPKESPENALTPTLEDKKQSRILQKAKYKHRLITAVFVIALFLLFQIVGGFVANIYYNSGGENSRLYKTQKTALLMTEFNMPNVQIPVGMHSWPSFFTQMSSGHSRLEIKPYLAAKGNYALQKTVGKKNYPVGNLSIFYMFSNFGTQWNWEGGTYQSNLYFIHPVNTSAENSLEWETEAWQALEMLPEGTVAELAVSFDRDFSLSELNELLADYDLDVTWYAISTGVEDNDLYRNHPRPLFSFDGAWGFGYLSHMMRSQYTQINLDDPAQHEEFFLNSMKFLAENEKIAHKLYRGDPEQLRLGERNKYLQENGVRTYGVIVTGPSKELLKLRDLGNIRYPALGDIELWNWFHPNFNTNLH